MTKSTTPAVEQAPAQVESIEVEVMPTLEERINALELLVNDLKNRKSVARELTDEERLALNEKSKLKKRQQTADAKGFKSWDDMQAAKELGFLLGVPYYASLLPAPVEEVAKA